MKKTEKPSSALRAGLGHAARIAFGLLAVYLLVRTGALKPQLLGKAITAHPALYIAAFVLYVVVLQLFACGRWYWLLRSSEVDIPLREVVRLHMTGLFFSGFLPGGTGGDLVKGYYLMKGRSQAEGAAALGTLVLDRIVGLFGLVGLAALTVLINHDAWRGSPMLGAQAAIILCAGAATLVLVLAYLSPWNFFAGFTGLGAAGEKSDKGGKRGFMAQLGTALTSLRKSPGVFLGTILLSMGVHVCLIAIYALCAQALDVSLPLRLHAFVSPVLTFVNGIPISPAGLGMGEAAGMVLYKAVGATHGQAEIPALVHTLGLLTALLSAPAYFLRRK